MTNGKSELLNMLQMVNYGTDRSLQVSAHREERQQDQQAVISIITQIIHKDAELLKKYSRLLKLLDDSTFNGKWEDKRPLGHIQRCVSSGDNSFIEFGLQFLESLRDEKKYKEAKLVLFNEGFNTEMAWTVGPLFLAEGKTFSQIMKWIQTGIDMNIPLKGLESLPIAKSFTLPDRYDSLLRAINPNIAAINTHPHYAVAQAIAVSLVARKIL